MKRILLVSLLLSFYSIHAQTWRLNGYAMYAFDDAVDSYYSTTSYFNTTIKGGLVWGAGLEYVVHESNGIELLYMRQDTKAPTKYYQGGDKSSDFDIGINYIMLGFNRYQRFENQKVEGFGGLGLGVGIFDITKPANGANPGAKQSSTKFAWSLKLGVNIYASEKFGIKLQTGLLSAVQSVGGGLYFGTGGAGAGVSTYSSMLQFQIGGGIVIPFGHAASGTTHPPKQGM
jgi:hypothetical protein